LTQQTSAPVVLVHISVLEESIHDSQWVVTTQLEQEPSVIIYISITMLTNHTLPFLSIASFLHRTFPTHWSLPNGSWVRQL